MHHYSCACATYFSWKHFTLIFKVKNYKDVLKMHEFLVNMLKLIFCVCSFVLDLFIGKLTFTCLMIHCLLLILMWDNIYLMNVCVDFWLINLLSSLLISCSIWRMLILFFWCSMWVANQFWIWNQNCHRQLIYILLYDLLPFVDCCRAIV